MVKIGQGFPALGLDDLTVMHISDASDLISTEPALEAVILDGVPGTPMPPWRPLLTPAEAAWIAQKLKSGRLE